MRDEVERAAVEIVGRDEVRAGQQDVLQGVGDGGSTAGYGQTGHAALEGSHAVLKDALRAVGQTAVDVAGVAQAEAVGSVLRIAEYIRRGLVDGHRAGVGGGVGLLLAYMKLEGLEVEFLCAHGLWIYVCVVVVISSAKLRVCRYSFQAFLKTQKISLNLRRFAE